MDFLGFAAAAGAGYVAKYLHKISKDGDGAGASCSSSTNAAQECHEKSQRKRGKKSLLNDIKEDYDSGSYMDLTNLHGNVAASSNMGAASSCTEGLEDMRTFEDGGNLLSLTSLPPRLYEEETSHLRSRSLGEEEFCDNSSGFFPESFMGEAEYARRSAGMRSVRSRRHYGYYMKPLNSLEICLNSQLYNQHSAVDSYMLAPLLSPSLRTRPLLITDGNRVISRASSEFLAETRLESSRMEDRTLFGAPSLSKRSMEMKRRSANFQRRSKHNSERPWSGRIISSGALEAAGQLRPQGTPNGMLLFLIGVTIGILSTAVANKRELDKLNELLKQTKNLVQDLQEEIEMNDSMTVKELVVERDSVQQSDGNIIGLEEPPSKIDKTIDYERKDFTMEDDHGANKSEILSQIEAELVAELERLESNMKGSSLEHISDFVELDPDNEADVAKGEFRLDTFTRKRASGSDSEEDNQDGTSTGHTNNANRPVSPRDLSLRLHEVIESRLEARIMELETALQDSHKRVHALEQRTSKARAYSEKESASPQSSASLDEQTNFDQPLVINLAGEALDAYNEAYEEIFRMVKTEDETPPDTTYNDDYDMETQIMNNGSSLQPITVEERSPYATIQSRDWQEKLLENLESGDESEDDDVLGKLLIQQIVEKTRQGSLVVLNAHRMLYSTDE